MKQTEDMDRVDYFFAVFKSLLKERKMTVAAIMKEIGKGEYLYYSWQTNRTLPPSGVLYDLSKVLGVSMDIFFGQPREVRFMMIPIFKNLNMLSQEDIETLNNLSLEQIQSFAKFARDLKRKST